MPAKKAKVHKFPCPDCGKALLLTEGKTVSCCEKEWRVPCWPPTPDPNPVLGSVREWKRQQVAERDRQHREDMAKRSAGGDA